MSGFTGSRGLAVVTTTKARLWTDGRYFQQAEKEMDPDVWVIMREQVGDTPSLEVRGDSLLYVLRQYHLA